MSRDEWIALIKIVAFIVFVVALSFFLASIPHG